MPAEEVICRCEAATSNSDNPVIHIVILDVSSLLWVNCFGGCVLYIYIHMEYTYN